jgi:hypothetical protein
LPPGLRTPATEAPGFMNVPDFYPPFEEPVDDNLEDPHDFSPDDPIWDDFYAHPLKLPKDPFPDWHRWLSESSSVP